MSDEPTSSFILSDNKLFLAVSPSPTPDLIVLRDETGQPWILSVTSSGQLLIEAEQATDGKGSGNNS